MTASLQVSALTPKAALPNRYCIEQRKEAAIRAVAPASGRLAELELGQLTTRGDAGLGEAVTEVERNGAR